MQDPMIQVEILIIMGAMALVSLMSLVNLFIFKNTVYS